MAQVRQRVSWSDRLPTVPDWVRENVLAALVGAAAIGIAGTLVFLATPVGHVHTSFQAVWVVLWSLTTLLALAGVYVSIVDDSTRNQPSTSACCPRTSNASLTRSSTRRA
jgi:integral membrane sensor domain MASE1